MNKKDESLINANAMLYNAFTLCESPEDVDAIADFMKEQIEVFKNKTHRFLAYIATNKRVSNAKE